MPNMAQANTSPAQANTSAAQANTSPTAEEPPLPDFHENGEPNWELFAACWPPLRNYPREDEPERSLHWVLSPTIPDRRTHPVDPREASLRGKAYIEYKSSQIQSFLDLLGNANSFRDDEIRRCAEWLVVFRRQLEITLGVTPETDVEVREGLEELIVKVMSGLEKALWFLRKKF